MSEPVVSICLPVLNAGPFLHARLESIFRQTVQAWELVAVDNYSDDGTWEMLQRAAATDPRVKISRADRQGMYANWNNTLRLAKGRWIYIATADDTMDPRCLEALLDLVKDCSAPAIAQCGLTLIDERGDALPEPQQWPVNTEWHSLFTDQFSAPHRRPPPFDGAAVMLFGTVITSVTQALFPREAFLRFGGFPTHVGSAGDMGWEGLLGFFHEIRYTPERLATWRYHPAQATCNPKAGEHDWLDRRVATGQWILEQLQQHSPALCRRALAAGLQGYNRFWRIRSQTASEAGVRSRVRAAGRMLTECPHFYLRYLLAKATAKTSADPQDPVTAVRVAIAESFLGSPLRRHFPEHAPPGDTQGAALSSVHAGG